MVVGEWPLLLYGVVVAVVVTILKMLLISLILFGGLPWVRKRRACSGEGILTRIG